MTCINIVRYDLNKPADQMICKEQQEINNAPFIWSGFMADLYLYLQVCCRYPFIWDVKIEHVNVIKIVFFLLCWKMIVFYTIRNFI